MLIENITDLRDDALRTLDKLQQKKIDINEAGATSKLYENIMSTVKTQLEVAKMIGRQPNIPFLGNMDSWTALENHSSVRVLEYKEKKDK